MQTVAAQWQVIVEAERTERSSQASADKVWIGSNILEHSEEPGINIMCTKLHETLAIIAV